MNAPEYQNRFREVVSMEPVRTWYGLHYAVVSFVVHEVRPGEGYSWRELSRSKCGVVPGTVYPYTKDGHSQCLKALRKLQEWQKRAVEPA